jgi:hypothetical protein
MNTKNLMCILAAAALLVSCAIFHPMGKRTEETGKVIGLTTQWITLQTATDGTWVISRTDSNTQVTGSLTLGSNVTIVFYAPPGYRSS